MHSIVTITSPAASNALATLDTVKSDLAITGTDDDTFLTSLIDRASAIVAKHCGRTFGQQGIEKTFRRSYFGLGAAFPFYSYPDAHYRHHHRPLLLASVPIVSITSITVDGTALANDGSDYEYDVDAGLVWRLFDDRRIHWTGSTIVVAYDAGYALPDGVPADLEDVCLQLIRSGYTQRGSDPSTVYELVENVGRVQYSPNRPMASMAIDAGLAAQLSAYVSRVF